MILVGKVSNLKELTSRGWRVGKLPSSYLGLPLEPYKMLAI